MIFRDCVAQAKLVEQLSLVTLQTTHHEPTSPRFAPIQRNHGRSPVSTDFCNKICHVWTAPSWQGESSRRVAGRCSHVFGLLARHTRPLALMPFADQVPVKRSHSPMRWH